MTQTFSAWILTGLLLIIAYPWAAWLLAQNPRRDSHWLTVMLTLAISTGTLTLVMFWMSLLGVPLETWNIIRPYGVLMGLGWLIGGRKLNEARIAMRKQGISTQRTPSFMAILAAIPLILIGAAILFNAVYWPFSRPDALGIYALFGEQMANLRGIVPLPGNDTLYEAYPIHISLTYVFAYLASGWTNEYLARLFPALMAVGCIPAAYVFGSILKGRAAGWASAILLAITPTFGRWASSGYVDLPMAFFYILSVIFAWRLWQTRHWTDALLAGVMMGLAAWTKNAALLGILFLSAWLTWAWLRRKIGWRLAILALVGSAIVAAPWYIRNWLQAGLIIPDTAWTDQAKRSFDSLLILPQLYGLAGLLMLITVILTFIDLLRRRFDAPDNILLLLWTVPFFAAWWLFVSYDPRFLLLFLPILCVMAGIWMASFYTMLPSNWQKRTLIPLSILVLILTALTVWNSVEFKDEILRDPLMSNQAKHEIVLAEE
jgi:Dolichyl-phosphate-mannose-protein mannosyltransferase